DVKDNGFSLNSIINQTKQKLKLNIHDLKFFNERLLLLGYFEDDSEHYNKMYSLKKIFAFNVASEFPRIIKSRLPLGIYNISYSIELSAVENFIIDVENILEKI